MYEDKTLVCKECGQEFVFTAGEQEFYASRGFENEPQRCKACRDARKNATRGTREMFTATCAACGKEARVPFKPREDRPVYCSECFAKMKEEGRPKPAAFGNFAKNRAVRHGFFYWLRKSQTLPVEDPRKKVLALSIGRSGLLPASLTVKKGLC